VTYTNTQDELLMESMRNCVELAAGSDNLGIKNTFEGFADALSCLHPILIRKDETLPSWVPDIWAFKDADVTTMECSSRFRMYGAGQGAIPVARRPRVESGNVLVAYGVWLEELSEVAEVELPQSGTEHLASRLLIAEELVGEEEGTLIRNFDRLWRGTPHDQGLCGTMNRLSAV